MSLGRRDLCWARAGAYPTCKTSKLADCPTTDGTVDSCSCLAAKHRTGVATAGEAARPTLDPISWFAVGVAYPSAGAGGWAGGNSTENCGGGGSRTWNSGVGAASAEGGASSTAAVPLNEGSR